MIRTATLPPTHPAHSQESEEARAARVLALRDAYLKGTLDLSIPEDPSGLKRLLRDVFTPPTGGRRRR